MLELFEIGELVQDILESGQITNGPYVKLLEKTIKEYYNVKHVIATSNCTMGLLLCLKSFDWSERIYMPSFTWQSPYNMISNYNSKVKFLDIDKETWNLEKYAGGYDALTFPTHTFGNIIDLGRENNVIYDGAHALGSQIKEFGWATVLSLAPTKLVTSCEGGLILTNNSDMINILRDRRDKSARMSEIHAIIGLKTFGHLREILSWKRKVYRYYKRHIPGQFQKIPIHSNYNTIGFLNTENLKIPEHITTKQYYLPLWGEDVPNTVEVYHKMVCLPSYYDCDFYQIVEDILELNGL
jgi:dTDP-4-amino-4,6-dideoxygalactose transaminase